MDSQQTSQTPDSSIPEWVSDPDSYRIARLAGHSDATIQAYEQRRKARAVAYYNAPGGTVKGPENLRGPPPPERDVEPSRGMPFYPRLKASFMKGLWSPESQIQFYQGQFGSENVRATPAGDVQWRKQGENTWHPARGEDWEAGDLGDLGGAALETVGMLLGPKVPLSRIAGVLAKYSGPIKQAIAGGMGGAGTKQMLGQLLTQQPVEGVGTSLGDVAGAGAAAGVGAGAGELFAAGNTLNPGRMVANKVGDALNAGTDRTFVRGMQDLQVKHGFPLSLSQETGSPVATMLEGFSGRTAAGRVAMSGLPQAQDTATAARAQRFLDELRQNPTLLGDENFGNSLAQTGKAAVDDVLTGMQETGAKYFDFRSKVLGKDKFVNPSNWRDILMREISAYKGYGDAQSLSKAAQLEGTLNDPAYQFGMSGAQVQHLLARYNAASYGKEGSKLFDTLDDSAKLRLSKDLHEALYKDLSIEAGGLGRSQSIALKQGLAQYSQESSLLQQLRNTPILRLLDKSGFLKEGEAPLGAEGIPRALLAGMKGGSILPSEMRNTVKLLQATDPAMADKLTSWFIGNAMKKGAEAGESTPQGFSRQAFADALPPREHLEALYKDVWNPGRRTRGMEIYSDMNDLTRLIERSNLKVGQGIPTNPITEAGSILHKMFTKPVHALGHASLHFLTPFEISKVMTDPTARAAARAWLAKAGEAPSNAWLKALRAASQARVPIGKYGVAPVVQTSLTSGGEETAQ